ncbi:zinc knuckle CX2CX4HX4C containing protein, partial [Tanacetum coccineum]
MASASPICLMARATSTKSWLWHQRLSHLNFDTINDLARNDLVTGLLKFKYHKEHLCPSCEQGKSKRASHPPKPVPNSKQRLHLLHMDLCGPMRIASINGKWYVQVIVDDYSRYTWVIFLRSKDEAPGEIKTFLKKITVLLQAPVIINDREYIGKLDAKGAPRTVLAAQVPHVLQTPTTTTTIADTAPTPTNSSSQAINFRRTLKNVNKLETQQQHVQHQPSTIADNVPNAMFDDNTFVNPFATPSTSAVESSSSQYVDPSSMHTFYQPYPHEYQWTNDHPLEQVIGEPSRPVLIRNESVDINTKSTSYARAAGVSAKDQPKVNSNFYTLVADLVFDGVTISIPYKVVEKVSTRFKHTLFGYFIGKRMAFLVVEYHARNNWAKHGLKRIMMNSKGLFFFKFDSRAGLEAVLEGGPWLIRKSLIILKNWLVDTRLIKEELTRILIWVKLHDIPIQVFEEDGISLISTFISKPVMLDSYTSSMCNESWGRSSFARCLIEVNSEADLVDVVTIGIPSLSWDIFTKETIHVEYEWRPPRCDICNIFDHVHDHCPKKV